VIATSDLRQDEIERLVHDVIRDNFGGDIAVIARTAEQFRKIVEKSPFTDADNSKVYFTLMHEQPERARLNQFMATDFAPEQIHIVNDTIYTLYATKYSDSKFNNNWFERQLKVTATTRNFNTMTRLAGY